VTNGGGSGQKKESGSVPNRAERREKDPFHLAAPRRYDFSLLIGLPRRPALTPELRPTSYVHDLGVPPSTGIYDPS